MTAEKLDLRVLYVEDEDATREEIEHFLRRKVGEVLTAENGRAGLEHFREAAPDIIISDIRMPVMDGLAMAREIRELDRDARIIFTTAHSDTCFLIAAIEAGVDHYVMKPVETDRLFAAIEKSAETIAFRKAAERYRKELEKTVGELQAALAKVKLLSGYLPICASCKKIRDDQGYWQQIEWYIRNHSEAEFSHGICPECAEKFYQNYREKKD